MRLLGTLLVFVLAVASAAGAAGAQTQGTLEATVTVSVVDTARAPLMGADVSVVRGLNEIIGRGTTDGQGRTTIAISRASGDVQLSVRKVGYQPSAFFFSISRTEATALQATLRRSVQTLLPVTVTATKDAKRKSYHVDADIIANSSRPLFDAMDIVTKLIPDVMDGRTGRGFDCGVKDVWVNGARIVFPPSNDMVISRIGHVPPMPAPTLVMKGGGGSGRRQPMPAIQRVDSTVWLTLASIKPEHIEEMTYEDCFSTTVTDRTHASQALFVVLKPGVGYDTKRGSYVISNENMQNAAPSAPPPTGPTGFPAYRARVLGVFDATTGDPIEHAIVGDLASGVSAETTPTGTVSLMFLPEGKSVLSVTKRGYGTLRVEITIAPTDSVPLTLVMSRATADTTRAPRRVERTLRQGAPAHTRLRAR